jgi:hypothetical protein
VTEIKVRAERRAGELVIEEQRNGKLTKRGQPRKEKSHAATLSDSGITKSDSSRWQKMARIRESQQPLRSQRSFALAAALVCHCMLLGASAPPQASGRTWSIV